MTVLPLTIPAGQSLSPPLQISAGLKIVRIGTPDAWDVAPITFQISLDGIGYLDLFHVAQTHEGAWTPYEVNVPFVVPNSILLLPPGAGANIGWLKIRSGTGSKPVNQAADRTFAIVFD